MSIDSSIKVRGSSGETKEQPLVDVGVYEVEIVDITYISAEQNSLYGKPQLRFKFKILGSRFDGVNLASWIGLSLNPGWDKGSPSHLYNIAKYVMGEDPDLDADFYPNVLMGGVLRILIEHKSTQEGKVYSRITRYLPLEDKMDTPESFSMVFNGTSINNNEDVPPHTDNDAPPPEDINNQIPF